MHRKRREKTRLKVPEALVERINSEHGDWYGPRFIVIGNLYALEPHAQMHAEFGLLPDDYTVLANVHDWGPMTANVICAITGRPKNSISRAVTRLADAGLLHAAPDTGDRRRVNLSLTDEGRAVRDRVARHYRTREQQMFGFLSKTELEALDQLLLKILRHWGRNNLEY